MKHRCSLCWTEFDTAEELAAHVAEEEETLYPLGDNEPVEESSCQFNERPPQFGWDAWGFGYEAEWEEYKRRNPDDPKRISPEGRRLAQRAAEGTA